MYVRLDEILTPVLLAKHHQHIADFLEMEGITPAAELGQTEVGERAAKELLDEIAHDVEQDSDKAQKA